MDVMEVHQRGVCHYMTAHLQKNHQKLCRWRVIYTMILGDKEASLVGLAENQKRCLWHIIVNFFSCGGHCVCLGRNWAAKYSKVSYLGWVSCCKINQKVLRTHWFWFSGNTQWVGLMKL
jgi:hypothetical protein